MSALPTFFKNKKVGTSDMELVPTMEWLSLAMPRKRFAQQRFCVERRNSGASER